jgi:hypothetical protein
MTLYLLTYGDGEDGHEWGVEAIFTTREKAEAYREACNAVYGYEYLTVEEWTADPVYTPG